MAPTAARLPGGSIRLFMGCWPEVPRSRIGWVDLDGADPGRVLGHSPGPVLDLGPPGRFDDDGVFPGHAHWMPNGELWLYYTGFQGSTHEEVDHFNFSGLAISRDGGDTFTRFSAAPVLDRADEGLTVRAGLSAVPGTDEQGREVLHCVYSAGTGFTPVGGKLRPYYEVFYQQSATGTEFARAGRKIVSMDREAEHGLGRPQLVRIGAWWYVFYTRRTLDMRYRIGCACSTDLVTWTRIDDWVALPAGREGDFDDQMIYFPSVLATEGREGPQAFLFYCGNGYGRDGFGYATLTPATA